MIDGTRKDGVYLKHEICGAEALISWKSVNVTDDFGGTYGELYCPKCGAKLAVYTRDPISSYLENDENDSN